MIMQGRFDELFFVDLPNPTERRAILAATLSQFDRDPETIGDLSPLTDSTDGFNGAEIAALVPDALFRAFADDERPLHVDDLAVVAESTVPLSKTMAERIDDLRKWADGRCRPASTVETGKRGSGRRAIDLN